MATRPGRFHGLLAAEVFAAVEGRLTIFHLAGFILGMVALFVAPTAFPHRGLGWRALIAVVAAILAYWAGFVGGMLASGGVLGILHLLGARPMGEEDAEPDDVR